MTRALSRRELLASLTGLALNQSCGRPAAPSESPIYRGPYLVGRAILGVTPLTNAMPLPDTVDKSARDETTTCSGKIDIISTPPANIPIAVYYPAFHQSDAINVPIQLDNRDHKKFPVALFAHGRRSPPPCPDGSNIQDKTLFDLSQDYTRAGFVFDHVASYGCVVAAPDLSWINGFVDGNDWSNISGGRSQVLVGLYQHLQTLNPKLFSNLLDLSRVLLFGHSSGGSACLVARSHLVAAGGPQPVAMGLLAPATTAQVAALAAQAPPLLVFKGTLDSLQRANPEEVFQAAAAPKVLVTISGANHFGYTDLCLADNSACAADDPPGQIPRTGQQVTAAAFLSAILRKFALGDMTIEPYLNGQRMPETDIFGTKGVQLVQQGM